MDELRKALDVFALRNAEGEISDAVLEKACEAYKARSEDFADDYSYNLYVAKYAGIYQAARSRDEVLGVYAALKGYDAMIQPNGNHCGNSFMIVFNRSKLITRK